MNWLQRLRSNLPILLLALIPNLLLASSGGHGGEAHAAPGIDRNFVFKFINFAIFFSVIFYIARKSLPEVLRKRSDDVAGAIKRAKEIEDQAIEKMREYDKKLSSLGQEMETLFRQAREEAGREKDRIVAEGRSEAAAIIEAAKRSAKRLEESLVQEARVLLTTEALAKVEDKVGQLFLNDAAEGAKRQDQMLKKFLDEVKIQ